MGLEPVNTFIHVSVLKTALVWMRVSIGIIRDDSETYSPYAFSPLGPPPDAEHNSGINAPSV